MEAEAPPPPRKLPVNARPSSPAPVPARLLLGALESARDANGELELDAKYGPYVAGRQATEKVRRPSAIANQ